jgi:hypothetical protein
MDISGWWRSLRNLLQESPPPATLASVRRDALIAAASLAAIVVFSVVVGDLSPAPFAIALAAVFLVLNDFWKWWLAQRRQRSQRLVR